MRWRIGKTGNGSKIRKPARGQEKEGKMSAGKEETLEVKHCKNNIVIFIRRDEIGYRKEVYRGSHCLSWRYIAYWMKNK